MEVEVQSEADATSWVGHISRIGELVNENTQSIDVFISISKNANSIYQGQYLKVLIPGKTVDAGMEVARNVVFEKNQVFVVQDSLLQIREIDIKRMNGETVVFAGLTRGADLVVEPLINAHQGMKVYKLTDSMLENEVDLDLKSAEIAEIAKN